MSNSVGNKNFWREFLELYRSHNELWDVKSEGYKNKNVRNRGYLALLKKYKVVEPNATVDHVKKKINTVRCNYRRELKKVLQNKKSGGDAEYKPSLWYFHDLSFLRDQDAGEGKTTRDSEENEQDLERKEISTDRSVNFQHVKKQDKSDQQKKIFLQKAVEHLERSDDEGEIYGRAWASEYKKLTIEQQLYAKKHIDDILFQGRLGKLTEKWPSQQSSSFRSATPLSLVSATYLSAENPPGPTP